MTGKELAIVVDLFALVTYDYRLIDFHAGSCRANDRLRLAVAYRLTIALQD